VGQSIADALDERARVQISYWALTAIKLILLTAILMVIAYSLFDETWTGSWQQMVAVLSWAFGLDITTKAVTGQFEKVHAGDPEVQVV
jgi:hypothetical protein